MLPLATPTPDEIERACGEDPGNACRWVMEQTGSETWAKVADFLVARPLKIALILLGAWLLVRVLHRVIDRFVEQVVGASGSRRLRRGRRPGAGVLTPGEPGARAEARAQTITQVLRSVATFVVLAFAATYVISELGLELGPLIAGAGVAGVALGFGAQSLVRDFLTGMFIVMEDQYGVGDVVDLGEAVGTVEAVTLRTTRVRDVNGTMWHVPNGQILRVGNKSQQWARAVLDVTVAHGADLEQAERVLGEVARTRVARQDLADKVLEEPEVWGVEAIAPEGIILRLVVKTLPGSQWEVLRALRLAVQEGLAAAGIRMPMPPGTVVLPAGAPGPTPAPPAASSGPTPTPEEAADGSEPPEARG